MTMENASQNTTAAAKKPAITLVHGQRYTARPTKDHGPTERGGIARYEIVFDLYDGEERSGVTCAYSGSLDGDWGDKTLETLSVCGAQGTDPNAMVLDYATFVEVKVKAREYQGKTYFEVQFVNPKRKPLAPEKAVDFAAKLKARFAPAAPTTAAPATAKSPFGKSPFGAAKTG